MNKNKIIDSALDLKGLSSNLKNDSLFISELLETFVLDLKQKLNEIEILLYDGNFGHLQNIVYSLKAMSSYLNMQYIWQAVSLLENAIERKDLKLVNIYMEILDKESKHLAEYLQNNKI